MQSMGVQGPGLSADQLIQSVGESDLRSLIEPEILSVLDAIRGGELNIEGLRNAASAVVDLELLLGQPESRVQILGLLSNQKLTELEERIGRPPTALDDISGSELGILYEFFGIDPAYMVRLPHVVDERLEATYGLFDHQRDAASRLKSILSRDGRKALLHLPTGVGKTRTAMHIVAASLTEYDPSVVVWLASGRELLEQAVDAFQTAWRSLGNRELGVYGMWGQQSPSLDDLTDGFLAIGLGKAWATMSTKDPDWAARLSSRTRLVVFDEAHQCIAPTYRRIVEELTLDHRCALLGLSATPGRTWDDIDEDGRLSDFFEGTKVELQVPSNNPIQYLVENDYLSQTTFRTLLAEPGVVPSPRELTELADELDVSSGALANLALRHQYVAAVLSAIGDLLLMGHVRVLVFAASVAQARTLAALLAINGTRCEVVSASTSAQSRGRAIRKFRSGDPAPMVLLNYGVLTTGFDAPKATAVVIARPTRSLVLFSQMVGRGIRGPRAGGTDRCEVVTVVDPDLPGFGDIAEAFLNWEDVW